MILDILAVATLAALIAFVVWRLATYRPEDPLQMESWLEGFSPASYQPMFRLSEPVDSRFLKSQRGPKEASRYRRLQRKMLRQYLRGLARDCHRLHLLASQMDAHPVPGNDNSVLAQLEEKLEFSFSVWSIELRLLLDEISPRDLNLRPLLANVEALTERARRAARRRHQLRF